MWLASAAQKNNTSIEGLFTNGDKSDIILFLAKCVEIIDPRVRKAVSHYGHTPVIYATTDGTQHYPGTDTLLRRLFLFWSVVFPGLRLHTSRKQVVSPAPWGSAPQVPCPSRAEGLRRPPVWFLFGLFVRWGDCCVAPRLSHARFFPQVALLFLSFSALSLSFSHDAVGREQNNRCPPQPPLGCNCMYVGGNAVRFFAVAFSGNSPETGRDRRGRQKNLVFPGISCDFVVGN